VLWPGLCSIVGKIANAAYESRLTRRGVPTLRIRKLSTVMATAGQLLFSVLFVLAPSARAAAACQCALTLTGTWHYSGLEPNYLDVGGQDIARIKGFLNTALWSQAYVISVLIVRLRVAFGGRWAPIFVSAPLMQIVTTGAFCAWATDKDYRSWRSKRSKRWHS
jgi:hypothetical protein